MNTNLLYSIADRHKLKCEDIDSLMFVLTRMRGVNFRIAFRVWMADEILRYKHLRLDEISHYNLYLPIIESSAL